MDNKQGVREVISKEDMEKFLQLLDQPEINLNCENKEGIRPIRASMEAYNPVMVKCLIEAGYNINFNADIYALNYRSSTPLHRAISRKDVEVTSMLLYYEVDLYIENYEGWTPLMRSFRNISRRNCQEVLLKYYDDFSNRSVWDRYGGLHLATLEASPFMVDLVKLGADVNTVDRWGRCFIHKAVWNRNTEIFKFIWSRMNHKLVLERRDDIEPFFLYYLQSYPFISNYKYLECLYLMLESPIAHLLIKDCIDYRVRRNSGIRINNSLVYNLLKKLVRRKVLPKDRLSLIYAFLSFGAEIRINDLRYAYKHYGFNEEFKALLCAGNLICSDYAEQIRHCMKGNYYTKGFSWLSPENKEHLINKAANLCIRERISELPEFPSLLELSRNGAQKYIQKEFKIEKLYQFHDAVNCLNLPQLVKDMILLGKPIYN